MFVNLHANGNTDYVTPLANGLIMQSVDRFIFPNRATARRGEWRGVIGIGFCVDGK